MCARSGMTLASGLARRSGRTEMSKLDEITARLSAASKAHGITWNERRQAFADPSDLEAFDAHSIEDCQWLIARCRKLEAGLRGQSGGKIISEAQREEWAEDATRSRQ